MNDLPAVAVPEPRTVKLREVDRELNRQLKEVQGPGVAPVVLARLSNLVIYCNSIAEAKQVEAEIPEITAIHPARVILLVNEPGEGSSDVTATVHTRIHHLGRDLQAISEQVTLRTHGRGVEHLPFAVRSLLIGDLPTNLWWAAAVPPAMAGALLYDLSEHVDQVIYDSYGWPEPARGMASTSSWLDRFEREAGKGPHRVVSDLTWRRLRSWRRLIAQALDPATAPQALETIREVSVDHGPHSVTSAWSLASWLALCLGWRAIHAQVRPGVEIDWRFNSPHGPRHMKVRRLADDAPRGIQEVRIACDQGLNGGTLVITPEDDGRRLAANLEGADAAPRTIISPPQPLPELVGRQLSDRDRDPLFHQAMTVAQSLAQSVLGA